MPQSYLHNPGYWRARAEEARGQANQMRDREAKQALIRIADIYDQLAKQAEATEMGSKPRNQ